MLSINNEKRALFVHIHKNGGTFVKKVLETHYGFRNIDIIYPIKTIVEDGQPVQIYDTKILPIEMRKQGIYRGYRAICNQYGCLVGGKEVKMTDAKWRELYKFTFVRNPYDRIVSAWEFLKQYNRDKLRMVLEKQRQQPPRLNSQSQQTHHDILFQEAVKFLNYTFYDFLLARDTLPNYEYLHAFVPQSKSMTDNNGVICFDFIGKMDNLNEDLIRALTLFGIKEIKHTNEVVNPTPNKKNYKSYYDEKTLVLVNEIFADDFKLLGFPSYYNLHDFWES